MNGFEFLRDAADRGGLYPAFAGMVQRLYELSAALNQIIAAQHTSYERSGEYARV